MICKHQTGRIKCENIDFIYIIWVNPHDICQSTTITAANCWLILCKIMQSDSKLYFNVDFCKTWNHPEFKGKKTTINVLEIVMFFCVHKLNRFSFCDYANNQKNKLSYIRTKCRMFAASVWQIYRIIWIV